MRALRQHLGLTQEQMAAELGTRQQTISEWETGQYRPRGTSARLLALIAERADFPYQAESQQAGSEERGQDGE
ncbi:MAG: helix-turn-helix domain-containing protein [Dehalococcoidia bacterium]